MTETELKLSELQKHIGHLAAVTQDGWVLKWGDTPQSAFEIVCRKANAMQVEKLDSLISEGYQKALIKNK
jgi:hypothetical protein